ncbi:secretin N-terminal domain-containing protein [Planctomycetota bacterium]
MKTTRQSDCERVSVRHEWKWCVLGVGLLLMVGSVSFAQTATESPAVTGDVVVDGRAEFIAFEKDSDVKEGLRILAALYEKNIVPSSKVSGMLGFTKLRNVTFEEAMDAVLGTNFEYEDEDNIIKVYTRDEYTKIKTDVNRMVYKVFTLYYISAAEAKNLLTTVLSANGTVQASTPAETVVPTGESISGGANGGDSMALNDTVIIRDYPEKIVEVETLLAQLDVRPLQVLVEATIMSAVLTEETQFGIDWNSIQGVNVSLTTPGVMQDSLAQTLTSSVGGATGLSIGISSDNARVFIRALEEVTDTTLMANPKILAVNKQLGQVYIGEKLGYREGTITGAGGTTEGSVKFLDTGTKLSFRPYIGSDGYIRMDIHPKDSSGSLAGGIPQEKATELATNIIVKDGQTIVIGGLFRDQIKKTREQVPLLGNIPVLGALFRSDNDNVKREEVIVLLTPHIIKQPNSPRDAMAVADASRRKAGAKDGVMLISQASYAEGFYTKASRLYLQGDRVNAMKEVQKALKVRPTYLEALRLKERILAETDPEQVEMLDRVVRQEMVWQEEASWKR